MFITFNKVVHTCWGALCLTYYIRYLNGSSKTHSPLLDLAGSILTYKNVEYEPITHLRYV